MSNWSRRAFLRNSTLAAGAGVLGLGATSPALAQEIARERAKNPRFLIVLSSYGGASIVDSFLATRASESANASTLNCYPDQMVQSIGEFRAVDSQGKRIGAIPIGYKSNQSAFVKKHQQDMMVITHTCSSVNHYVAAQTIHQRKRCLGKVARFRRLRR